MKYKYIKATMIATIVTFCLLAVSFAVIGCQGCSKAVINRQYISIGVTTVLAGVNFATLVSIELKKKKGVFSKKEPAPEGTYPFF